MTGAQKVTFMKRHCFTAYPLFALIGLILSPLAVAYASPAPADSVHFCLWQRSNPDILEQLAAGKQLARSVGKSRTVRTIYLVPSDQTYEEEEVSRIKETIRRVRTFYAQEMADHGYGNKTFQFETDAKGDPKVHRVNGVYPEDHYNEHDAISAIVDELYLGGGPSQFDFLKNDYLVVLETDEGAVKAGGSWAGGVNQDYFKNGGLSVVPSGIGFDTIAHELGHTFGLLHDFRNDTYVMSYGSQDRLSACAAEFLSVHPYFNSSVSLKEDKEGLELYGGGVMGWSGAENTEVEMITDRDYPAGSKNIPFKIRAQDPQGMQQVQLHGRLREPHDLAGWGGIVACRSLSGKKNSVAEFKYDVSIPPFGASATGPYLHWLSTLSIDIDGNTLWDSDIFLAESSPHQIASFEHEDRVYSIAFSPDDKMMATIEGYNPNIYLWDTESHKQTARLDLVGTARFASFSPDGTLLAVLEEEPSQVSLWDVSEREQVGRIRTRGWSSSLSFSSDGKIMAVEEREGEDNLISIWEVDKRKRMAQLETGRRIHSFSLLPDGKTIVVLETEDGEGQVWLWDVANNKKRTQLQTESVEAWDFSFSSSLNGERLAIQEGSHVSIWDVSTRKKLYETPAVVRGINKISLSSDGKMLAILEWGSKIGLWDVSKEQVQVVASLVYPGHGADLSFSNDGMLLAASGDYHVRLWDVSEWTGEGTIATVEEDDDEPSVEPQAWLTPDPSEVQFSADDPAWKTFTVHTSLDSVLVHANPSGSDPAIEVEGGARPPTREYCPAEGNDRPRRGRQNGWNLHVKVCQAGQTKILLKDYDTGAVLQQYEINVEASATLATTRLNPSYPNPFNSETILSYTLPTASDIRLEVFTLSGQRVAVLHEGFQAAGYHTIAMDASALASGVYLYRLTTPEGRFTQKFTLLR